MASLLILNSHLLSMFWVPLLGVALLEFHNDIIIHGIIAYHFHDTSFSLFGFNVAFKHLRSYHDGACLQKCHAADT